MAVRARLGNACIALYNRGVRPTPWTVPSRNRAQTRAVRPLTREEIKPLMLDPIMREVNAALLWHNSLSGNLYPVDTAAV